MNQDAKIAQHYLKKQVESASSAEQLVMLYDGAIRFLLKARQAIIDGKIEERHNNAQRASDIIAYLIEILNLEKGGEVGYRLMRIYSWLLQQALEIDMKNDVKVIDAMIPHLKTLRKSWETIAKGEAVGEAAQNSEETPPNKGPRSATA